MVMRKCLTSLMLAIFLTSLTMSPAAAEAEAPAGEYYSLVNEDDHVILQTATEVTPGDVYIAADNSRYEVAEVNGYTAQCVYKGKEPMPDLAQVSFAQGNILDGAVPIVKQGSKSTIAVYHTHSDESYVPTDGKESIEGKGGIYDVGQALADELKSMGFNVEYSTQNHNPHDINAYNRSRKTAAALMKSAPDAIIDVHRDAVPPGQYQTKLNGKDATKIKLVVGRSNPNSKTNLEFAKNLKAAMDQKVPGLSNGIFMGKGSYNQDLSPRAMLIEVGAHTNNKNAAQQGVKAFASVLPTVLGVAAEGGNPGNSPAQKPASEQNSGTTILILLLVVAAAGIGFYLLNKGSLSKK